MAKVTCRVIHGNSVTERGLDVCKPDSVEATISEAVYYALRAAAEEGVPFNLSPDIGVTIALHLPRI